MEEHKADLTGVSGPRFFFFFFLVHTSISQVANCFTQAMWGEDWSSDLISPKSLALRSLQSPWLHACALASQS